MSFSRPYESKLGIVTGGSRGIGVAVAHRLVTKGCNLLLVFTSDSSTLPTARLCEEPASTHKICCTSVQADLADPKKGSDLILQAAKNLFGSYTPDQVFQVDILINNAGISSNQHMNDEQHGPIDPTEFDRVYKANVLAPLLLTKAVAPYLPKDRSGRIVTVSSVSSSIGYQGHCELAERATVNTVNPGPAWGGMYEKAGQTFWDINQPYVDAAPLASYNGEANVLAMAGSDADRFNRIVRENRKQ